MTRQQKLGGSLPGSHCTQTAVAPAGRQPVSQQGGQPWALTGWCCCGCRGLLLLRRRLLGRRAPAFQPHLHRRGGVAQHAWRHISSHSTPGTALPSSPAHPAAGHSPPHTPAGCTGHAERPQGCCWHAPPPCGQLLLLPLLPLLPYCPCLCPSAHLGIVLCPLLQILKVHLLGLLGCLELRVEHRGAHLKGRLAVHGAPVDRARGTLRRLVPQLQAATAAAQGGVRRERPAQRVLLHVAVAGCRNAARVERRLHEPRAIDPEPGPAAPEIGDRQEALGDGDEIGRRGRIDRANQQLGRQDQPGPDSEWWGRQP